MSTRRLGPDFESCIASAITESIHRGGWFVMMGRGLRVVGLEVKPMRGASNCRLPTCTKDNVLVPWPWVESQVVVLGLRSARAV